MFSKEIIDMISFYGGIASIIALFLVFANFLKYQIKKALEIKEKQEQEYNNLKDDINALSNNANSFQSLQSLHILINTILTRGQHQELRLRINLIILSIMTIITLFITALVFKFILNDLIIVIIGKFIMFLSTSVVLYANYRLYKILILMSTKNDILINEFLNGISNKLEI